MTHPTNGLDEVVHQRVRLGILAMLAQADEVDFGFIQETLDLTPGNLSRHITTLEEAGLVRTTKGFEGKRPRTWVRLTAKGRRALQEEVKALKGLLALIDADGTRAESLG